MSVEERLRAAMRQEAEGIDVDPGAWDEVQQRAGSRKVRRNVGAAVLAVAAMVAAVVGAGALLSDDDRAPVDVVSSPGESTTSTTEGATSTTTGLPPEVVRFAGIWPFASEEAVQAYVDDPGVGMFFDGEQTALEFAREYLGMPDPVATAAFDADGDGGSLELAPKPGAPMRTTVDVRRFGGADGAWSVVGARTPDIEVDTPAPGDEVGGTIELAGTSTAYEATVQVQVREDGQPRGEHLAETFVMGGANGEMAPFSGEVEIDDPTADAGAVVFTVESAEDGTLTQATVVRVHFRPAEGGEEGGSDEVTRYSVFFHRGEELVEVRRESPSTAGVLREAMLALFAGPRPEDGDGLSSLFGADTAGELAGVNLRPDGTAVIDLAGTVDNASTSAGSVAFLAELNATTFQFPTVSRIEYRLRGSCDDFWEWLQVGSCQLVDRPAG